MIKKVLLLSMFIVIILSCELPVGKDYVNNEVTNISATSFTESSTYFEKKDSSEYIFKTNDTNYLTSQGYTIWCKPNTNESESFEEIEVQVCKRSGSSDTGYGLVFCCQTIDDKDYMLTVMIDTQSHYIIGEVKNGEFITIKKWTSNEHIKKGFGIYNKIKITYDEDKKEFNLIIENSNIFTFAVTNTMKFKDSKWGYVAVVSNTENFPYEYLEVEYK